MTHHVVLNDSKATTRDRERQAELLREYGARTSVRIAGTEDELVEAASDADGLLVDAGVPVTGSVIDALSLDVVGRVGIGVDNVDLDAAARNGVTVVNHPTYSIDEVATHALTLLLTGLRRVRSYDRRVRAGEWESDVGEPIRRLQGSTIGLLAFGKISRRLATMVQGFGCTLIAHDPYVDPNVVRSHNVEPVDFDALLSRADLLSVHAPLTDETRGMLDRSALASMDDDAVLVNTGRGPVVDIDALVECLDGDGLGAVGLDVTDPEPLPTDHPLFDHEHVVVTPHVGWYSEASRRQVSREVAVDVGRVLVGDEPKNPVSKQPGWE